MMAGPVPVALVSKLRTERNHQWSSRPTFIIACVDVRRRFLFHAFRYDTPQLGVCDVTRRTTPQRPYSVATAHCTAVKLFFRRHMQIMGWHFRQLVYHSCPLHSIHYLPSSLDTQRHRVAPDALVRLRVVKSCPGRWENTSFTPLLHTKPEVSVTDLRKKLVGTPPFPPPSPL